MTKLETYNALSIKLCPHTEGLYHTEPGKWCLYGAQCGYYDFQSARKCGKTMNILVALEEIGVDLGEW